MNKILGALIRQTLKRFGIGIERYDYLRRLQEEKSRAVDDLELLTQLPEQHAVQLLKCLRKSRAQLRQDLFVLSQLGFKRGGFFVEFGATNGVDLSNTYLLESEFAWNGILAEPAKSWHQDLRKNRKCYIETDCVWRDSNSVLIFNEVTKPEYSTIKAVSPIDVHRLTRKKGTTYEVNTISLTDLLGKYEAPRLIDYLSVDTEGSEYEILREVNFDRYQFNVISCEHNFTEARAKIFALLTRHGYIRTFERFSKFDDWYVMGN